ncbi:MAG: hypothetical protein ABW019_04150, partial [Chitinophagaceae bacterium]
MREVIVLYPAGGGWAELASLNRLKDVVYEVVAGMDWGITFNYFNDIKQGDVVEAYEEEEVKRTL